MKPGVDPTSDSLISGLPTQNQASADPGVSFTGGAVQAPQAPQSESSFQTTGFPQPTSPFAPTPEPLAQEPSLPTISQPMETSFANPTFANPASPTMDVQQPISPPQPIGIATANPQTTSPLDTPPAPASQPQPTAEPINLGSTIVEEKPKRKTPVFLIFFLLLVIIVLGAVGYLAYQNYVLNKNITTNTATKPSLTEPTTSTDPYAGYSSYKSTVLPIEFMIPSAWKAQESEEKDLANQKIIKVNSPDFAYQESTISSGFEFRVGPVNDLTKKYDSFDALAAEINATNIYTQKTINGTPWLIGNTQATTLLDSKPLTVAIYSSVDMSENAIETFAKILNSIKITAVTPSIQPASSSATPAQ